MLAGGGFGIPPRKRKLPPSSTPDDALTCLSLTPIAPAPWLAAGSVPRLHHADERVPELLRRQEPVVLTGGCPLARELVQRWSFAHLAAEFGDDALPVHCTPRGVRTVRRVYGDAGEGCIRERTFADFAASSGADENAYLQVMLRWARGRGQIESRRLGPVLSADLERVDWRWLESACGAAGDGGFEACQLWASHGGVSTPCHFDGSTNFVAQLRGRKHFLLLPPGESFKLCPHPVGHPRDNFSLCDLAAPDTATFPAIARARGWVCTLEPGDVLFLPRYWWHYVHQDEAAETASLNFWCAGGRRLGLVERLSVSGMSDLPGVAAAFVGAGRIEAVAAELRQHLTEAPLRYASESDEAAAEAMLAMDDRLAVRCLHAARAAEVVARAVVGADGGRLLAALAAGGDASWPPEGGARALVERLRRELAEAVDDGRVSVRALLRLLSRDGRLHPGLAAPFPEAYVSAERGDIG